MSGHWRAWLSLGLIVALMGGTLLCLWAGGRRTDSAYGRFARQHLAADVVVYQPFGSGLTFSNFDRIASLAQVQVAATIRGYNTTGPIAAVPSGAYWHTINVPKVLSGRLPRPDRPDEVAVTYTFARRQHLSVGSRFALGVLGDRQPGVRSIPVRVTGIEVSPGDFPPALQATFLIEVAMTPAFLSAYQPRLGPPIQVLALRLRHGDADVPAFERGLRQVTAGLPQLHTLASQQAANVRRGFHLQALALWLLGGFLAVAVALVLAQLVARQSLIAAEDDRTLRALGMTRTALWLSALLPVGVIAVVGATVAAVVALAASPLFPLGTARMAEPHTGLAADWFAVGVGAATIAVTVVALSVWPAWRAASGAFGDAGEMEARRSSLVARASASAALPPEASVGIASAFQPGRGRTAVPVRSSLTGLTLAIAALTVAVTFGASLTHLLRTPVLYGWNWDARVGSLANNNVRSAIGGGFGQVLAGIESDTRVEAIATVGNVPLLVGNSSLNGVTLASVKGDVMPVLLRGREPRSSDEIALGARTMRDLHAHLGATVPVSVRVLALVRAPKRVVGVVVVPPEDDAARLGVGAVLTGDGLQSLIPPGNRPNPRSEAVVRLAPGVDRARTLANLGHAIGSPSAITTAHAPNDLVNFGHVQNLPLLLAMVLALLAIATLAHTLTSLVGRRARDLATLKTLGFVPGQVRRMVAWQATAYICVALLIGMPLGVAGGRLLWSAFATQLGTLVRPVTPPVPLLLLVPAALVVANVVASVPAFFASRTAPARLLRSE